MSISWEDWILIFLAIYVAGRLLASIWQKCLAEEVIAETIAEEDLDEIEKRKED